MSVVEVELPKPLYGRWPLLCRAMEDTWPAYSAKVEWLVDLPDGSRDVAYNYCQIVRTRFYPGDSPEFWAAINLANHLDEIEEILWDGVPSAYPKTSLAETCGGVRHYLGRDPMTGDRISFRSLRPTILTEDVQKTGEPVAHEYLTEFSLLVAASHTMTRATTRVPEHSPAA